jgi:hypothetical protein
VPQAAFVARATHLFYPPLPPDAPVVRPAPLAAFAPLEPTSPVEQGRALPLLSVLLTCLDLQSPLLQVG